MNILSKNTDKYLTLFFQWLSLAWQFASITSEHCGFLNIDISQGSVATQLRRDGIFKYMICCKFITESASERILKIG